MDFYSSDNNRNLVPALPENISECVKAIFEDGTPENTKKAYKKDLYYFQEWARATTGNSPALP
ncbi:hypothetical protein [Desulforegula conservatrix]|uniref:hypothetical protein n=1 Tax=Desulforegula conservatrix TaxID=153026 RepID=UPI0004276977|nr:hypothetical protein [Desulforegula conservatrix]